MLPLAGIKVVEFCQVAAGPFCGMLLADMGADVIKVESPEGDGLRQWPPIRDGDSENFASVNRNKRSVVLDLKNPAERAAARRLALSADVVVENFRPGVLQKLGLGYDALAADKPSLVYCSISAFGQTGPRAQEGGFDLTVQAISGVMSVTGEKGGAPVKCGVPISDFTAGLYAAFAIAAALHKVAPGRRRRPYRRARCSARRSAWPRCRRASTSAPGATRSSSARRIRATRPTRPSGRATAISPWPQATIGSGGRPARASGRATSPTTRASRRLRCAPGTRRRCARSSRPRLPVTPLPNCSRSSPRPACRARRSTAIRRSLDDPQVKHMEWVRPLTLPGGAQTRTVRLAAQDAPPALRCLPPSARPRRAHRRSARRNRHRPQEVK